MSAKRKPKLLREVEKWLRATGRPWQIKNGTKHYHVILAGECIGVVSNGCAPNQDAHNIKHEIDKRMKKPC